MISQLSVSGGTLKSCNEIIHIMYDMKIFGDVTANTTITPSGIENGCRILISSQPPKEKMETLWNRLKKDFNFQCAHCSINQNEAGCALDIFRQSVCPANAKEDYMTCEFNSKVEKKCI